jgi:hypothetical protein
MLWIGAGTNSSAASLACTWVIGGFLSMANPSMEEMIN